MNERDVLIAVESNCATMWTLSADRRSVRLALPPLRLAGMLGSLTVFMDFDAESVDAMLERLSISRSQMLPALPALAKGK